jgi:hypothetical protein
MSIDGEEMNSCTVYLPGQVTVMVVSHVYSTTRCLTEDDVRKVDLSCRVVSRLTHTRVSLSPSPPLLHETGECTEWLPD